MPGQRFDSIDTLRGVAIVWMTAYHLCFDLNRYGFLHQNFFVDPFWTWQRTAIVSLFLFCAGLGQSVAVAQQQSWARFWKRWAQIAVCAVLVTAGSYLMFPRSFIYFGVLHGIAVMLIVARMTAGWRNWLWLAGAVALAMKPLALWAHGEWSSLAFLNEPAWNWLGLISRKPVTVDYVPVFPWLGVVWWGMAAGQWLQAQREQALARTMPRVAAPLAFLGRWSLSWYMLHQPILIGIVMLFAR